MLLLQRIQLNTETFKTLFFEEKIIMDSIRRQSNAMFDLENKLLNEQQK